jgi:hypothetical protein
VVSVCVISYIRGIQVRLAFSQDVNWSKSVCQEPQYSEWGTWVLTRVSTDFCGDMVWCMACVCVHVYVCVYV